MSGFRKSGHICDHLCQSVMAQLMITEYIAIYIANHTIKIIVSIQLLASYIYIVMRRLHVKKLEHAKWYSYGHACDANWNYRQSYCINLNLV